MSDRRGGPLATLLRLRARIGERREAELAAAAEAQRVAEAELALAGERWRAGRDSLCAARARQLPATAAELGREEAWQRRLVAELEALELERAAALSQRARRDDELVRAREALARARAELKAVEQAWQAWDEARRTREQRRAEDELADLVAARTRRQT